ncbi:DnaB-like helicase N-terminal domain-containing protein [Streptomyces tremellae]|uniref:DNA helicase DnaB-like N-terminal domain-containing protein n=1 Tax=Streptomyces tremellae TaxID=1124239 RepID=A0ABP7EHA6_9ACTN
MENVHRLPNDRAADHDGFTRIPPQDLAAEQSVLGGMILSRDVITDILAALRGPEFYRPAHETIFRAIVTLYTAGEPVDPITLTDQLHRSGDLDRVGGAPYLHHLVQQTPTAANASYYADIVRDRARERRVVEAGLRITQLGYEGGDPDEMVTAVQATATDATSGHRPDEPSHLTGALLDWAPFFQTDFASVELLLGKLMAAGQQITIVGDGKAGKSLFVQEWMWRMASGQPFLSDHAHAPVSVLYVDAENGHQDIQERFISYGAGPGRMGLLSYASFPPIRPLDTPGGGADLLAMAREVEAQIVVLDTVSRFISGPENDSDTWLALYRNTLLPLKRAGIGSVRLDHMGKDAERGARGSSAKTQDVDHVWTLSAQGGGTLLLRRTHTRTGIGPDQFVLHRQARRDGEHWAPGGTRHVLATWDETPGTDTGLAAIPGTAEHIVAQLDRAQVPSDWGSPRVIKKCAELGIRAAKSKIEEAVRIRKNRPAEDLPPHLPYSPVTKEDLPAGGPPNKTPAQTSPGEVEGTLPHVPAAPPSPRPPSQEGGGGADHPRGAQKDHPRNTRPKTPCTVCGNPIAPEWAARGYDTHTGCAEPHPDTPSHPHNAA